MYLLTYVCMYARVGLRINVYVLSNKHAWNNEVHVRGWGGLHKYKNETEAFVRYAGVILLVYLLVCLTKCAHSYDWWMFTIGVIRIVPFQAWAGDRLAYLSVSISHLIDTTSSTILLPNICMECCLCTYIVPHIYPTQLWQKIAEYLLVSEWWHRVNELSLVKDVCETS